MEDRDYNQEEGNVSSEDGGTSAESIAQEPPSKRKKIPKTKCHKNKKMCSLKRSQEEIDQRRGYSIHLKGGGGTGGILSGASLGGSGKAKKVYKCTHCDYNSSSSSMIWKHVNVEHNKVRLECTECDYWTLNATNLLNHR